MHEADGGLWRDRAFVLFWLSRAASLAGSAITTVVLPVLVFQLTGSAAQTAALAALAALPYLAFGLVAGAVADRFDRRRMMVGCDLLNAALVASVPLAAALGVLGLPQIYAVALLSATLFVWFDAANFGALPALVGRERIVAANSTLSATYTIIGIAGPSVAGLLIATLGAAPAVAVDAASFGLSALLLAAIPRSFAAASGAVGATAGAAPAAPGSPETVLRRTLADIREGLRFLWGHRLVRTLTLVGFAHSVAGGAVLGLLVVYAVRGLGLPEGDARIGWLFSAGAAGALGAALLLPRLTVRYPVGRITLVALALEGLLLAGLALAPGPAAGLPLYLLWNGCAVLVIINGISLRQLVTPDGLQSRVNATGRMIAWGGTPFGAAVGGLVAEAADVRTAYLLMAALLGATVLAGWRTPLRERVRARDLAAAAAPLVTK